jgi:hypothetical protein
MATNMMRSQAGHRVPSPRRGLREWALLVLEVLLAVGAVAKLRNARRVRTA